MTTGQSDKELFQIIFSGELVPGAELSKVKLALAKLFGFSEQKAEQLFSGKRIVVKSGVDEATAGKYSAAFKKAGAICSVVAVTNTQSSDKGGQSKAEPTHKTDLQQQQAPSDNQTLQPALRMAPVGARLGPQQRVARPPKLDIDHMEMLPAGSDIGDEDENQITPELDIDHISVAPVGAQLEEDDGDEIVEAPDISHLAIVSEKKEDSD